jgi:hypothetical protein
MMKETEIRTQIEEACGIVDNKIDGIYVYFSVKEMIDKIGSSMYRTIPLGRYQINVDNPYGNRDCIFRTKKGGTFDLEGVKQAILTQARARHEQGKREAAKLANQGVAEAIRNKYPMKNTYVSAYAGSTGSFCAPSTVEGLVQVQISFGSVDPETAEKILAFAQSIKG